MEELYVESILVFYYLIITTNLVTLNSIRYYLKTLEIRNLLSLFGFSAQYIRRFKTQHQSAELLSGDSGQNLLPRSFRSLVEINSL